MATKLKNLKVKRVAFVDEGANPDAHITFAKRNDQEHEEEQAQSDTAETGIIKRIIDAIAKAFGLQPVEKEAQTFSEKLEEPQWDMVSNEAYNLSYLFMDSIRSILYDDADSNVKAEKMRQSVSEFSAAFNDAIQNWATGKSAAIKTEAAVVLAIKRDILKALQEDESLQQSETDLEDSQITTPKGEEEEPPIVKGETEMKFDTSKMTPEELATFNDLQKRYGQQQEEQPKTDVPATDPTPDHADKPDTDSDDVSKSMKEVQAELAELREFKAEAEDRALEEVAKKYELLGQKPETLVPVLKSMKALGEEQYNGFIASLDASLSALEQSNVFGEIGKRGGNGDASGDAWGKIEAAAIEVMKNKPGMTREQAIDAVCISQPELLSKYEKSRS